MLLCVGLAFPGCVVEKISAWKAVRRSFRLSKGTRGRIFILYLLGAVLGWILSFVITVIFVIVAAMTPALNSPQHAQAMGMAMLFLIYGSSFAVQAFTKPVYAIALMLFYYDQRIRNEGFDIEWMMERAGLMPGEATAPSGEVVATPAAASGPAPNDDRPGVPIETKPIHENEDASGAAQAQVETEATVQMEAAEATETTEATQPESGVQP
jgi:hypothetical protein